MPINQIQSETVVWLHCQASTNAGKPPFYGGVGDYSGCGVTIPAILPFKEGSAASLPSRLPELVIPSLSGLRGLSQRKLNIRQVGDVVKSLTQQSALLELSR